MLQRADFHDLSFVGTEGIFIMAANVFRPLKLFPIILMPYTILLLTSDALLLCFDV